MNLNLTWSGLLCGAILLGCHGLRSATAASAPSAADATPAGSSFSVPGPDRDVLSTGDGDEERSFPYWVIMDRNPFRLNPQPPPQTAPPPPPPELPHVILSGTRAVDSTWKAMFAIKTQKTAKDQESTTYLSLSEGEKEGPVEVLKISPDGDEVTINNSGTRQVLTMKDNGFGSKGAGGGGPAPAGLIRNPPTPGAPPPSLPATTTTPASRTAIVGPTGGGPSARYGGDMIVGGPVASEPSRTTTTAQPAVASMGGGSSTSGRDVTVGGYVAPPTTSGTTLAANLSVSPSTIGGTPHNTYYTNAVQQPNGIPLPPMPTVPGGR